MVSECERAQERVRRGEGKSETGEGKSETECKREVCESEC